MRSREFDGTVDAPGLPTAIQHHKAGNLRQAEVLYRRVLQAQPDHYVALHLLGVLLHQRGDHGAAVDFIARAIAANPVVAEFHNNLGEAHRALGKLDEAVTSYERALALRPDYAAAHNNLANALVALGKAGEAVASYRQALESRPDHAPTYFNLGNALAALGRLEKAVACYREAIALEPNLAEAHGNLGNTLKEQGKLEEAVACCRKAIALKPDVAEAHSSLGNALMDQGQLEEAVACCRKAIALKPGVAEAHSNLGIALKRQGKLEEAITCYRRAMEIKPDYVGAHYNHAMLHKFFPGDPEIEKLKELSELQDASGDERNHLLFALGKAHDDIRLYAEAFAYYRQGNEEQARRVDFDASCHRKRVLEVKRVFQQRHGSVGENLGSVDHVPVFVIGMSRSGKTLVESLLSQHEDAYGAGETREWKKAIKKVFEKYSISERSPNYVDFAGEDQIREIGSTYMRRLVKNSTNSKLFINTLPSNYRFVGIILQTLPTAKIIYCRRDPTDNCLFVYFSRYQTGHDYSYDLKNVASYYAVYWEMMEHWQRLYGDRIFSVRYEDLVRNPGDLGARIYEYCGLDYDPTTVRHAFTTDEIGHWKHYEPYLDTLRQALGGLAQ